MLKSLYALGISMGVSIASLGIALSATASHCSAPNDCEQTSPQRHHKAVPSHGRTSHQWLSEQTHLHNAKVANLHIAQATKAPVLPSIVDLRPQMPAIYDQGQLGSCTANALAAATEYELMQQTNKTAPTLSRLAIYYGEREMEGTIAEDAGASLSDGIMFLHKTGACSEATWPYSDHGTAFTARPSQRCYDEAKNNKDTDDLSHAAVQQSLTAIQTVLAHKLPVTVGLMLYQSFESPQTTRTGIVNMPQAKEQGCLT